MDKKIKITLDITFHKEFHNSNTNISINGDWYKEIGGGDLYHVKDIFKVLSDNEDFDHLINKEIPKIKNIRGDFYKKKVLHDKEREFLLYELFGFTIQDGIIYTEEGEEFYADENNQNTDLDTLENIIKYYRYVKNIEGKNQLRSQLEKLMKYDFI